MVASSPVKPEGAAKLRISENRKMLDGAVYPSLILIREPLRKRSGVNGKEIHDGPSPVMVTSALMDQLGLGAFTNAKW